MRDLVGTTALKKKGLRRGQGGEALLNPGWNYCPEEEGIKTHQPYPCIPGDWLELLP